MPNRFTDRRLGVDTKHRAEGGDGATHVSSCRDLLDITGHGGDMRRCLARCWDFISRFIPCSCRWPDSPLVPERWSVGWCPHVGSGLVEGISLAAFSRSGEAVSSTFHHPLTGTQRTSGRSLRSSPSTGLLLAALCRKNISASFSHIPPTNFLLDWNILECEICVG